MTEDEALRRAIIADPGNCTLRLIYADWLDDHDQAEAAALFRLDPVKALEAVRLTLVLSPAEVYLSLNTMDNKRKQ